MGGNSPSGGSSQRQLTSQEMQQIQEQTETLRRSRQLVEQAIAQQNLAQPLIFGALGFDIQQDADGQITAISPQTGGAFDRLQSPRFPGAEELPDFDPATGQRGGQQLQDLQATAFGRALEAERDPQANLALEQSISDSEQALENQLVARYGADYLGSSGGQNAFSQMATRAAAARATNQREDIGFFSALGSQLLNQQEGIGQANFARDLATFQTQQGTALTQQQLNAMTFQNQLARQAGPLGLATQALGPLAAAANAPSAFIAPTSSVAAGFSGPLDALIRGRSATLNAYADQPSQGQGIGGLVGGLIGTGVGAYYGGPQGAMAGGSIGSASGATFGGLF